MSGSAGLRQCDRLGCAAAGVLPFVYSASHGEPLVLLAMEQRKGVRKLNFIGGMREGRAEQPWQMASREFEEETGGSDLFSPAALERVRGLEHEPVLFCSPSKYALFACELPQEELTIAEKLKQGGSSMLSEIEELHLMPLSILVGQFAPGSRGRSAHAGSLLHHFAFQLVMELETACWTRRAGGILAFIQQAQRLHAQPS
jgi:hypothetical protein